MWCWRFLMFFLKLSDSDSIFSIILALKKAMVQVKNNKLSITIECGDPTNMLKQLRSALTVVNTVLVTSDEFYNNVDLPEALASLITLQGELVTDSSKSS